MRVKCYLNVSLCRSWSLNYTGFLFVFFSLVLIQDAVFVEYLSCRCTLFRTLVSLFGNGCTINNVRTRVHTVVGAWKGQIPDWQRSVVRVRQLCKVEKLVNLGLGRMYVGIFFFSAVLPFK